MTDDQERTDEEARRQSVTLASEAATVAEARKIVRKACAACKLGDEAANMGALIMSELVTNAVRHSRSHSVRVIAEHTGPDRLRVAVADKSRRMPDLHHADPETIGGRGLILVDALSDRWGTDLLTWGKRVWADILVKPEGDR